MLTTFDRYLLRRYFSTFLILLVSTYGLFVVIDGFTNVDSFQDGAESSRSVLSRIGTYYAYRVFDFFDMVGPTLCVISVTVVLGVLQYQRELHPVLAAGVPAYRMVMPLVAGAALVTGLMVLNTEFVIPRISMQLQTSRDGLSSSGKRLETVQDYELHMNIDGSRIDAAQQAIKGARFIFAAPVLVDELTTIESPRAIYYPENDQHPAGWLLKKADPPYDQLKLTELGRKKLLRVKDPGAIFLVSQVTFAQVYSNGGSYLYDSTPQLVRRITSPALSQYSVSRLILHLHNRLARPFQNLIAVFVAIPFVMRRESRSLIGNMAISAGVLVGLMAALQFGNFLASANVITPDFAVWLPVLLGGGLAAWQSHEILT